MVSVIQDYNQEKWEIFLSDIRNASGINGQLVDGMIFIDSLGAVLYEDGFFKREISLAKQEINSILSAMSACQLGYENGDLPCSQIVIESENPTPNLSSFHCLKIFGVQYQVFSRSWVSFCATSYGRYRGLIAQKFSSGILVMTYRWPHTLPQVFPIVDDICSVLRR